MFVLIDSDEPVIDNIIGTLAHVCNYSGQLVISVGNVKKIGQVTIFTNETPISTDSISHLFRLTDESSTGYNTYDDFTESKRILHETIRELGYNSVRIKNIKSLWYNTPYSDYDNPELYDDMVLDFTHYANI